GAGHTVLMTEDGSLLSCGDNLHGQLGRGDNDAVYGQLSYDTNEYTNKYVNTFKKITNLPKNIVEIACGSYHTVVKTADGKLSSCGHNHCGQLGHGDNKQRNIFEEIKE